MKLLQLLKETPGHEYPEYMYSPVGFGCHVCKYHFQEEGIHKCSNDHYQEFIKEKYPQIEDPSILIDNNQKPVQDPSKWCSNWFMPKVGE